MKKINIENTVTLIARKSKIMDKLDYYVKEQHSEEHYLFTRNYSSVCYNMCKGGASINRLLKVRDRNTALMGLVKYLKISMPYFVEYYGLKKIERENERKKNRTMER
jgi:hypothetical protein